MSRRPDHGRHQGGQGTGQSRSLSPPAVWDPVLTWHVAGGRTRSPCSLRSVHEESGALGGGTALTDRCLAVGMQGNPDPVAFQPGLLCCVGGRVPLTEPHAGHAPQVHGRTRTRTQAHARTRAHAFG